MEKGILGVIPIREPDVSFVTEDSCLPKDNYTAPADRGCDYNSRSLHLGWFATDVKYVFGVGILWASQICMELTVL